MSENNALAEMPNIKEKAQELSERIYAVREEIISIIEELSSNIEKFSAVNPEIKPLLEEWNKNLQLPKLPYM